MWKPLYNFFTLNQWQYLTLTLEDGASGSGTLKVYLNGELKEAFNSQMQDNDSTTYAVLGENV